MRISPDFLLAYAMSNGAFKVEVKCHLASKTMQVRMNVAIV